MISLSKQRNVRRLLMKMIPIGGAVLALAASTFATSMLAGQVTRAQIPPKPTPTPAGLVNSGAPVQSSVVLGSAVIAPSKTTDQAPLLPGREKAAVIVQHADGTYERVLLDPKQVDSFIRSFRSDTLVTMVPPQTLIGHAPPQDTLPHGLVQYPGSGSAPTPPAPPAH